MIPAIYRLAGDPAAVAALVGVVLDAAESGDSVARSLVAQAGRDLAALVATVARTLAIAGQPFPLALTGGVLLGSRLLRESLDAGLTEQGLRPGPVVPVPDPVAGAVRLAARLREEPP